jgi:hypothetical protein
MRYILINYVPEAGWDMLTPAQQQEGMAAAYAYNEVLTKAGVFVGSNRLRPSETATTIRVVDGKTQVQDGPYADTKEQFGGYYMIDVPDLDAALAWAARCPGATYGAVEVRAIWEKGD